MARGRCQSFHEQLVITIAENQACRGRLGRHFRQPPPPSTVVAGTIRRGFRQSPAKPSKTLARPTADLLLPDRQRWEGIKTARRDDPKCTQVTPIDQAFAVKSFSRRENAVSKLS
jgi:hypothetical protein